MTLRVGVIDYGMGNLHSVAKALSLQRAQVIVSDDRRKLESSDLLVLPGVGAFGAAMKTLASKRLDDLVARWIENDRPYLGICLGFQLLFERSEESKGVRGLSILNGNVVRFREKDFGRKSFQIPHMGWNTAKTAKRDAGGFFKGIGETDRFYFVHSYFPEPDDNSVVMTRTPYGKSFCSSVSTSNLFATQFHPEKSGAVGQRLLKNIVNAATSAKTSDKQLAA